jgi:hypothetical protein
VVSVFQLRILSGWSQCGGDNLTKDPMGSEKYELCFHLNWHLRLPPNRQEQLKVFWFLPASHRQIICAGLARHVMQDMRIHNHPTLFGVPVTIDPHTGAYPFWILAKIVVALALLCFDFMFRGLHSALLAPSTLLWSAGRLTAAPEAPPSSSIRDKASSSQCPLRGESDSDALPLSLRQTMHHALKHNGVTVKFIAIPPKLLFNRDPLLSYDLWRCTCSQTHESMAA